MSIALQILAHLGITPKSANGAGTYRFNMRATDTSKDASLVIHSDATGFIKDHKTGDVIALHKYAQQIGIATERATSERPRSRLDTYAREHGAESEAIYIQAGWRETTYQNKPALAIKTDTGVRYRMLAGSEKYKSVPGYRNCWYRLKEAIELAHTTKRPLVLCNGESSVVVAQLRWSVPATAKTGSGESKLPAPLLQELQASYDGAIVIALDSDKRGREARVSLYEQLRAAGFMVRVVELGLFDGGDIADYLGQATPDELYALPSVMECNSDGETVDESIIAGFLSLADRANEVHELPDALIDVSNGTPLLLQERVYVLGGDYKQGKSTLVAHLGYCVATGASAVLGSPDIFVPSSGRVIIFDLEQELSTSIPRYKAMQATNTPLLTIVDADTWEARSEQYETLSSDELIRTMIATYCNKYNDTVLVVVDNLSLVEPAYDMRVDRASQEGAMIQRYKRLAKKYKCCILLIEHNTKGGEGFNRMRGTTIKQARPNGGSFLLEAVNDGMEAHKAQLKLSVLPRDGQQRTLYLRRDNEAQHHVLSIALEGLSPDELAKINNENERIILDALQRGVETSKELQSCTPFARSTIFKLLRRLIEKGVIVEQKRGIYKPKIHAPLQLSDESRAMLGSLKPVDYAQLDIKTRDDELSF